jgi:hypothetical protein
MLNLGAFALFIYAIFQQDIDLALQALALYIALDIRDSLGSIATDIAEDIDDDGLEDSLDHPDYPIDTTDE